MVLFGKLISELFEICKFSYMQLVDSETHNFYIVLLLFLYFTKKKTKKKIKNKINHGFMEQHEISVGLR